MQIKEYLKKKVPLLLCGIRGIGKKEEVFQAIRFLNCGVESCTCVSCQDLGGNSDLLLFTGEESLVNIQDALLAFVNTPPKSLKEKYIYFENLEHISLNSQNSLLRLIENPPDFLRIFASCEDSDFIPKPLLSRFFVHRFQHPKYDKSSLVQLLGGEAKILQIKELFDLGYEIPTPYFVECYVKYKFFFRYQSIIQGISIAQSLELIDEFYAELKELHAIEKTLILRFFVEYLLFKIKSEIYEQHFMLFDTLLNRYSDTLLFAMHHPNPQSFINLESQIKSLISSFFILRKLVKK